MRAGQRCREHHLADWSVYTKRMAFYDFLDIFALRASHSWCSCAFLGMANALAPEPTKDVAVAHVFGPRQSILRSFSGEQSGVSKKC
ncbi:hypothetical protein KC345_g107 [Hortaea werneckii]|nr:hypothetical protein KC345_g107 [Hortaea werneckii]